MSSGGLKPLYERLERLYKHQFFQWVYIDDLQLIEVVRRFDELFKELHKATDITEESICDPIFVGDLSLPSLLLALPTSVQLHG
ncbi:MAG: hypothetical protein Q9217_000520 [Psora testacea]